MSILEVININKKAKILISSFLISISFISLPFNHEDVNAIAVIDDALLLAGAGILTVAGVGAYMGLKDSDLAGKLANSVTDSISDFGNSAKIIYEDLAFGYDLSKITPALLSAYGDNLEGVETIEADSIPENKGNYFTYSYSLGNVFEGVANKDSSMTLYVITNDGNSYGEYYNRSYSLSYKSGDTVKVVFRYVHDENFNKSYPECYMIVGFVNGVQQGYGYVYLDRPCNIFSLDIPNDFSSINYLSKITVPLPAITDTTNYPSSISLSKDKVEEYVGQYVYEYPDDNDNKPDYSQLIPFMLDLLEKDLGNGEITPQALSDSGIVSYVFPDDSSMGYYPYYLSSSEGDVVVNDGNVNVTVNNNIGSDVSEEEKNGILNMLDNGLRSTTERLKSLGASLTGFKDNVSSLFSFLPEDVVSLFYLAISLSVIFFILSLRRG